MPIFRTYKNGKIETQVTASDFYEMESLDRKYWVEGRMCSSTYRTHTFYYIDYNGVSEDIFNEHLKEQQFNEYLKDMLND